MAHVNDHIVDDLTADIALISLHDGDPGDTGTNEISGSGSSGTYARLAPTYGASSSGSADLSAALQFDGPNNQQVTHYGVWITGPTFLYGRAITGQPVNFNSDGRLDLNSAAITATNT